jgi:hypothetical protein
MNVKCAGAFECLLERYRKRKLPVDYQDSYRHRSVIRS